HLHLSAVAHNFLDLDVTGVSSKQDMLKQIREKANALKPGEWLLGRGWDENLFADGIIPSIQELDYVAPHCPLFISRVCGHAFLTNSKALEASHYHSSIKVPEGGTVVSDPMTMQPTGLI